jgi:hypothetical protein
MSIAQSGPSKPKANVLDVNDAILTYRYLRITMVAVLVMLGASVLWQGFSADCWLSSVSAYYYTPVRSVFVGSLISFGAALIAYRGPTPEEEALLNLSGCMALVVAFVPTRFAQCETNQVVDTLTSGTDATNASDSVSAAVIRSVDTAVTNNIASLVIAAVVALALVFWVTSKRGPKGESFDAEPSTRFLRRWWNSLADDRSHQHPRWVRFGRRPLIVICSLIPMAGFLWFLLAPESFAEAAHVTAAITMVVGLILYMFANALLTVHSTKYARWYCSLAVLLILVLAGIGTVIWTIGLNRAIFWLEYAILGIFVIYWIVQSFELRGQIAAPIQTPNPARRTTAPDTATSVKAAATDFSLAAGEGGPASDPNG